MSQYDGQDEAGRRSSLSPEDGGGNGHAMAIGRGARDGLRLPPADLETRATHADMQAHIGRQLRAVYESVVEEPVPDRLLLVLEKLAAMQPPQTGGA